MVFIFLSSHYINDERPFSFFFLTKKNKLMVWTHVQPYVNNIYVSSFVTDNCIIATNTISYLDVINAPMKSGRLKWNTNYNWQKKWRIRARRWLCLLLSPVSCTKAL